ncbi:AsmA family protein [Coralliovum pocilloporae]|uniref:AsmA family protein n=1 Tax=Coralliovum pocilloporae TaxID=3066369 RepID=UPI003306CA0F
MKRIAALFAFVSIAVVLVFAGLPLALSTQSVKEAISDRISTLTGYSVTLTGDTDIRVFPFLTVRMSDVQIRDRGTGERPVLMSMDRLDVSLNLLSALTGTIDAKRFTLVRPHIDLDLNDTYSTVFSALSHHPLLQQVVTDISRSDRLQLEDILVEDGRISLHRPNQPAPSEASPEAPRETPLNSVSDIAASISVSGPNNALNISGSLLWNNETLQYDIKSSDLSGYANGEPTAATLDLRSDIMELSFNGQAVQKTDMVLQGALTTRAPSIRYVANWLGVDLGPGSAFGHFALNGTLNGTLTRFSLADATIVMDGNTGDGALNFTFGPEGPEVTGTVAFDVFDASTYVFALAQPTLPEQHWTTVGISAPGWSNLSADIRFSAAQTSYHDTSLGELAAALRIHQKTIELDIASLELMGGHASGALSATFDGKPAVSGKMRFTGLSAATVSDGLLGRAVLDGRLTASAELKGSGRFAGDLIRNLTGRISVEVLGGSVKGFDLSRLDDALAKGDLPRPDHYLENTTPAQRIEAEISLEEGIARIEKALLQNDQRELELSGESDLITLGINGKGRIRSKLPAGDTANSGEAEEPEERPFSLTGRLERPIIAPDLRYLLKQKRKSWQ